jgi:hypothetical protein
MRIASLIRPLAAAALITSALGLAACGGDDPGADGSTASQARDAELKFARCMREHGLDMPDPQPGQRGLRLSVPKGTSPDKVDAAQKACQKYMDKVKPPELTDEEKKEFHDAALANARCMRAHGITKFPDPTFGPDGGAQIKLQRGSGIDPDSPKFKAAMEACEKTMPQLGTTSNEESGQ